MTTGVPRLLRCPSVPISSILSVLGGALALYFGWQSLIAWTFDGLALNARRLTDTWPLIWLAILIVFAGIAFAAWRQSRPWCAPFALAVIGWSLGLVSTIEFPDLASAFWFGAGPALRPMYPALALASGWFAFGGPLGRGGRFVFDFPVAERALLLFTFWGTANGKLFARAANPGFALLNLAGILAVAELIAGHSPRELIVHARRRLGICSLLVFVGLPLWWFAASAMASSREPALQLAWRLGVSSLLAVVAVASVGAKGETHARQVAHRIFAALVFGLAVVLIAALFGIVEASRFEPLDVVLSSRLRVLGLHPNLGAALFAAGLPLCLGWIFAGARMASPSSVRRAVGSVLFAGAVLVLYLAGSRTGGLGAGLGLLAFGCLFFTTIADKLGPRVWLILGLAVAVGIAVFLSPIGADLRAALDAKAQIQSALGQRWHIWRMSAAALGEHPVWGLGPLGFSGHAQHALSSYSNGTSQTLHTHNIFMAAAEGAGWIGLVLFTVFLGALCELLRRAVSAAPRRHPDRALAAATCASFLALLACNQLDLGQSQLTFIPLLFFSALAIGGLLVKDPVLPVTSGGVTSPQAFSEGVRRKGKEGASGRVCYIVLVLFLWPAGGATLVGVGRRIDAQVALGAGDEVRANAIYTHLRSPLFMADDVELTRRLAAAAHRAGDLGRELRLHAELAESLPNSPFAVHRFAQALITGGRYRRGLEAARRTRTLDPFGVNAAPAMLLEAWAVLGLLDREAGVKLLLDALDHGAMIPNELKTRLDALLGDIDLVERLDLVGVEIVEQAASDEVAARRRLAGIITAFEVFDAPNHALAVIEGVIEASSAPNRSVYYELVTRLVKLGRSDEARRVIELSPFRNATVLQEIVDGPSRSRSTPRRDLPDIFFTAGRLQDRYLERAIAFASAGEMFDARCALERALYNAIRPIDAADLALDFIKTAGGDEEQRLWQLQRYVERASVSKRRARDSGRMVAALEFANLPAAVIEHMAGELANEGPVEATFEAARALVKR